jgi:hypothetical protein
MKIFSGPPSISLAAALAAKASAIGSVHPRAGKTSFSSTSLRMLTGTGFIVDAKGSRKNKIAILGGEASAWQSEKTQGYLDITIFRNAARRDASAFKR